MPNDTAAAASPSASIAIGQGAVANNINSIAIGHSAVAQGYGISIDDIVTAQPMTAPSKLLFRMGSKEPLKFTTVIPINPDDRFREIIDEVE